MWERDEEVWTEQSGVHDMKPTSLVTPGHGTEGGQARMALRSALAHSLGSTSSVWTHSVSEGNLTGILQLDTKIHYYSML